MGRILITFTDENEKKLRLLNRKKGDLSKVVDTALTEYFRVRMTDK